MGYIKLFRTIQGWGWWDDPNTLALWAHLLIGANWKDSEWHGEIIPRGTLVTSVSKLAIDSGLSDKQVRVCLERLVGSGEITKKTSNKWTKITICNYDNYQASDDEDGQAGGKQLEKERAATVLTTEVDKNNKKSSYSDAVERIYALYPTATKRPDGNKVALKSSKKNKAHITRLLGSGEYSEESLTQAINRYLSESKPEYIKMFETFLNQIPDYSQPPTSSSVGNTESAEMTYEDAIKRAKNPTKEEIKAWWDKRMAPFYPQNPGETKSQYRARVLPSYESELKSWIENRVERVNQKYL